MTDDPYFLEPEDALGNPRVYLLHVSGGRTSGYMLRKILDSHGGSLPDYAHPLFTNTGKEREETLVFLGEIERRWGVALTWLEYVYRADRPGGRGPVKQRNYFRKVSFETASRDGEPFESFIDQPSAMLPNPVMRLCTSELKVETAARYARYVLELKKPWSVLGIRYDEPKRWGQAINEECRTLYPMVLDGVSEADVLAFWADQPFDLGLRPDQGNCDLCFLKGKRKVKRLIREEPARADWWIKMEGIRAAAPRQTNKPHLTRFFKNISMADLKHQALTEPELPMDDDDTGGISCFCGD